MRQTLTFSSIVVAYGGNKTRDPYLYRSYDHPEPHDYRPKSSNETKEKHHKPLRASDLPLWQIGRATSAAPTYFAPMRIGRDKLLDGAMGGHNNPVTLAFDEVSQMHWRHDPLMVISIGTGTKPQPETSATQRFSIPIIHNIRETSQSASEFQRHVLDSEEIHASFERELRVRNEGRTEEDEIKYFRFNIPHDVEQNLVGIKLGEWKGDEGSLTERRIRAAVDAYVSMEAGRIRECARKLVQVRRRRQETARWESFALSTKYCCPEKDEKCKDLSFDSRKKLKKHGILSHGFIWQVKCVRPSTGQSPHLWTCFWEQCGENRVSVFQSEAELEAHFRDPAWHGKQNAKVMRTVHFELWLDKGRKKALKAASRPRDPSRRTTMRENT